MRVLVLTNGWPTEAHPEYAVFNARQVDGLRALGARVDVEFVNARDHGKIEYLKRLPRIGRQGSGYDIVHCFHGLSFLLARLGGVRTPLVVSFLNAIDHEYAEMSAPVAAAARALTMGLLRRGGQGVIFKDAVPAFLRGDPLARHIANGVETAFFTPGDRGEARAALGLESGATYLLFVSSKNLHRPQKRYDRFLAAVAALRARRSDLDIRELTLVDEPRERVRLFYRAADVHLMTSDFEGSPNSVKEAMACELPVVAPDVGNVREMIEGLDGARLVDAARPEAVAAAVDLVLGADAAARAALRARIDAAGLESLAVARKVLALYDDVIAWRTSAAVGGATS